MMRVYSIKHFDACGGYTTTELDNIKTEFEVELDEYGEDPENGFTKENIPKVMKAIGELDALKDGEAGKVEVNFGPFVVTVGEMHRWEYEALPEWDGW
ncbi:hypothetical protein [Desulfitobacterium hafniense]|uniref:hypothetical protein n=1 Tax=Desulfitobacterium hafniense TaxID=49338 RepID=UPI00059EA877|nr:hypothetical protein [Desulfitobacterium hafniense]